MTTYDPALVQHFYDTQDAFFRPLSFACLDLEQNATAYGTGIPVADLNPVSIRREIPWEESLQQIRQFYASAPFVVCLPESLIVKAVENILNNKGFKCTGESVAMALILAPGQEDCSQEDGVIQESGEFLEDWASPLVDAFGSTPELTFQYAQAHERALDKGAPFEHFTLYCQNKPMASLTLSLCGDSARIDDMGTLPTYQGRGYATRLMKHALAHARKRGATQCFLEASSAGIPLYERIGFLPLFRAKLYHLS